MIRIKYITRGVSAHPQDGGCTEIDDCLFIADAACTEYDWLVVYDEMPRGTVGTIRKGCEELRCPREHTILVTVEPPTIKLYPACYTRQFGHVLTTHSTKHLPHPHRQESCGALHWMADYPLDEAFSMPMYEKSRDIATVCSSKQQKHTLHYARYALTAALRAQGLEFDWYGHGVKPLAKKYEALSPYRYHIAVENYIAPHHWTDKISDPLLAHCLTFYAGDPCLGEVLPPESFIPIPVDDHAEAYRIIREAVANNEYEKRLPAILEARRRIVEQYNFYRRVMSIIHSETAAATTAAAAKPGKLCERHRLRRNPLNALSEGLMLARFALTGRG